MRKILLSLALLGGLTAGADIASAAPVALSGPVLDAPASLQTVQYYGGWRRHEYWRARRYHAWRRHEWRRRHYGYGYGRY